MAVSKKHFLIAVVLIGMCFASYFFINASLFKNREKGISRQASLGEFRNVRKRTKTEKSILLNDDVIKKKLNDPSLVKNWGLTGTNTNSHIHASKAWNIWWKAKEKNRVSDVVVAVIDTGIDIKHEDLKNNLWVNKHEIGIDANGKDKSKNKIDDDGNGFVDDVHGWNFVSGNKVVADRHGHGTHVSGILGAEGGNSVGVSGVAPKVKIMTLKYYDPMAKNNHNLLNTIKSINYAVKMGAQIINYSGGGLEFSRKEYNAIKKAQDKGILFVAAAGNERSNSDNFNYYPANYRLDNIISVTAINPRAEVLKSSNWGVNTVHIAAPGESIFSTLPNSHYGSMTGTSQATAFVTGVAALIFSINPNYNYLQVKDRILSTAAAYETSNLLGKNRTSGRLNSWAALAMQPRIPVSGVMVDDQNHSVQSSIADDEDSKTGNLGTLKEMLDRKFIKNSKK